MAMADGLHDHGHRVVTIEDSPVVLRAMVFACFRRFTQYIYLVKVKHGYEMFTDPGPRTQNLRETYPRNRMTFCAVSH